MRRHLYMLQGLVFLVLLTLVVIPPENDHWRLVIMEILMFSLLAISFDVAFGFTGLLSLGQALFFGTAAYFVAFGVGDWGLGLPAAGLVALVATVLLAAATGFVAIRVKGHSFLIVTLIFVSAFYVFAQNNREITGGDDGLVLDAAGFTLFGTVLRVGEAYYLIIAIFIVAFAATLVMIQSPFGQVLRAIKENDVRCEFLGYNTRLVKLAAFCWAGGLAGLGGICYAIMFHHVHTGVLHWTISADALIWGFFGGLGTLVGPVLGVAVLLPFEDVMSDTFGYPKLFTGLLLVAMVLVNRAGLAGLLLRLAARRGGEDRATASEAPTPRSAEP